MALLLVCWVVLSIICSHFAVALNSTSVPIGGLSCVVDYLRRGELWNCEISTLKIGCKLEYGGKSSLKALSSYCSMMVYGPYCCGYNLQCWPLKHSFWIWSQALSQIWKLCGTWHNVYHCVACTILKFEPQCFGLGVENCGLVLQGGGGEDPMT